MALSKKKHERSQACIIPGGFTVLSIQFSSDSTAQHRLCVKEHKVRTTNLAQRPMDRTLFVLNIPPYCLQGVVQRLFSQFGTVQSVELTDQPGSFKDSEPKLANIFKPTNKQGFKVGYIIFEKPSSITAVKSHPFNVPLVVSTEQHHVKTGVAKWIQQYTKSFIQPEKLQQTVDTFMQEYDKKKEEEAEQQRRDAEEQREDEEGWVKVTRGNKRTKSRPHTEVANHKALQKEIRKKKRKELINFYTWQHKNTQKEHIAQLRTKFEEDKQRIAVMRAQRKFRPY